MSNNSKSNILWQISISDKTVNDYLTGWLHFKLKNQPFERLIQHGIPNYGLRLRPFLLKVAYERKGRMFSDVLPVAAAIELIQLSTLVIDDFLDNSKLRNGKVSVFAKWGPKYSVTAGIIMESEALSLLSESFAQSKKLRNPLIAIALLQQTHSSIYAGQFKDLKNVGRVSVDESEYMTTISATTGKFIQTSLVIGALLRNASPVVISVLEEAGHKLGLAYQLRDDVIDLIGSTKYTGKPFAGDVRERKMRLPVIHAVKKLRGHKRTRLVRLYQLGRLLTDAEVQEAVDLLDAGGAVEYVIGKTKGLCNNATESVRKLPRSEESLADKLTAIAGLISNF